MWIAVSLPRHRQFRSAVLALLSVNKRGVAMMDDDDEKSYSGLLTDED
jgi:hypothetical protein